ncbi:MAG TPA: hypothetical protein VJS15_07955 [Allosphingosinicella sp.]|nr:hypothetical protein [Allosphingosinicella sp.]
MTSTRSRLTAVALCAVVAILACSLYLLGESPEPDMKVAERPMLVMSPAEPLPARSMGLPKVEATGQFAAAVPDVSPTAAPGVAFNYRYAFRLAAPRIAAVQEEHVRNCERLGIARCRVTGLLYRVVDARTVEARLELKLDPAIARRFGRTSVDAVVRAEGMLAENEISGTDAAGAIAAAGRGLAESTAELARIEARLRALAAHAAERPELDYQAMLLRQRIRALRDGREAQHEALATTPMLFQYGAGERVPDSAGRPGLGAALARATDNFASGISVLLIVLITLLPWALTAFVAWMLARFVRRRWFPAPPATA